jgi:tRNA-splicing ligase RtcB
MSMELEYDDLEEAMKLELEQPGFRFIDGIPVFGPEVDEGALAQIKNAAKVADRVAMMGDHHKGYGVPVGGVVAYRDLISPSAVGFDIACGVRAVRTDMPGSELRSSIVPLMDAVQRQVSFGVGRKTNKPVDHKLFDSEVWKIDWIKDLKDKAYQSLGSSGGGNHFCDLATDEQDMVWAICHFGSRGFGWTVADRTFKAFGHNDKSDDVLVIDPSEGMGVEYVEAMKLAGEYAYAGRHFVTNQLLQILGAKAVEEVEQHHNYAWRETHEGQDMWVVRKGATPAFPGQKGVIGGSMCDNTVIVEGVESPLGKYTLNSTVHGAGRQHSRTWARGKMNWRTKEIIKPGNVSQDDLLAAVHRAGVELRGGDVDEAPMVYKKLRDVLACHEGTIKILHTLKPVGVCMASSDTKDPYKD